MSEPISDVLYSVEEENTPSDIKSNTASASGIENVAKEHKSNAASDSGIGNVVASHYNNIQERGKGARVESRIFHLRNFNNWIKSVLINEYATRVLKSKEGASSSDQDFNVLDIGCGKGGDLLKWDEAGIDNLVCADIAATSVMVDARERYRRMLGKRRRNGRPPFEADFIAADCTKQRLLDLFHRKELKFDIVSCQFAFHYCFESIEQAECMLRNASESLRPGGYFIGTVPDATDLVARVRQANSNSVSNSVYSITFDQDLLDRHISGESPLPLFGAQYMFHLEGVVDCPEFLVHFPTLCALAEKYGLMMIAKRRFESYFEEHKSKSKELLVNMKALEIYPPLRKDDAPKGNDVADNYAAADAFLASQSTTAHHVATMSREEWEALTIYQIFAFKKM